MSGTVKVNQIQLGDSGTAANNFVLSVPASPDGTVKLSRGNVGATTQDVLVVDSTGNAQLKKTTAQSMVRVHTANGFGSTNTVIRRFTTVVTNQGTDITYADSATAGASFTINTDGVYAISYSDNATVGANVGVSLNSTQLTTAIDAITSTDRAACSQVSANYPSGGNASTCLYLPAGSVIRPHFNATTVNHAPSTTFTITRVS